ncbi:MAG: hypothetical protein HGB08_02415 [Candidatus Moranbacteria bacterium]|nr:hypothetical protein [Candidatus Moranbacteria bacterium]
MAEKNIDIIRLAISFFVLFFIWVFMIGILIYGFGMNNSVTRATAKVFPYPAAIWGTDIVTVGKLESDLLAARRFYEAQDFSSIGMRVDFTTDQGVKRLRIKEKNILNKLIENRIVETEAKKRGIRVSDKDVSGSVKEKMQEYGSEQQVTDNLKKLYGWTMADFEKNIVKPDLYRERLAEDIRQNDPANRKAKEKIEAVLADIDSGKSLEDAAKEYSEGESAQNGGDLGWFTADQMLPEISKTVFLLNKGEKSGIIESGLGFHIVLLEDKSTQDGVDKVKLKQVFVRAKNLPEWLTEKEKDLKVNVLLKGAYWNNETGGVDFKDRQLKNFEENLDRNSPDDISVLF